MSDPRYPIGKFAFDGPTNAEQRKKLIADIERAPAALRAAVKDSRRSRSRRHTATAVGPCAKSFIMCLRAT